MAGIIVINLGTPNSPSTADVRSYLREFLSDPYVIDIPAIPRWILVNCIIAPFRAPKSAHAYASIWTEQGSPLLVHSVALCKNIQEKLPAHRVVLAMRYGKPDIAKALDMLKDETDIIVLPLYPQYAGATTQTVLDSVEHLRKQHCPNSTVHSVPPFYNHPTYIENLAHTVTSLEFDHLLMSYHGLPIRQLPCTEKNQYRCHEHAQSHCPAVHADFPNCYRAHCYETSRLLATQLNLPADRWSVSFQSRLGKIPWIEPYTSNHIETLRNNGVEHLAVICPSFVTDCLETLEEIDIGIRADFLHKGGKSFTLIPCLNAEPAWAVQLLEEQLQSL